MKTKEPIKVGVLLSCSGVTSAMECSMLDFTMHSINMVNESGGINGRELSPIHYDPTSQPEKYKYFAEKLIAEDGINIIFGCYMSSSRKAVLPVIEKRNALLFFPAQYEGFEYSKNVIYCGAAPNQDSAQLGRYLLNNFGNRFYMVGSDYIWPLESARIMSEIVKSNGGNVVGEKYRKLDQSRDSFDNLITDIKKKNPDVIFCNFVGENIGHFYDAYAQAGLDPKKMPIASLTTSETDIQAMGAKLGEGHITSAPYFQSIDSKRNKQFISEFKAKLGQDCVANMCAEAAYFQVQIVADAIRRTESEDTDLLRSAILGTIFDAPQGKIRIDPTNAHTYLWPRIGRAQEDGQFQILAESDSSIRPEPYMASFDLSEWGVHLASRRET